MQASCHRLAGLCPTPTTARRSGAPHRFKAGQGLRDNYPHLTLLSAGPGVRRRPRQFNHRRCPTEVVMPGAAAGSPQHFSNARSYARRGGCPANAFITALNSSIAGLEMPPMDFRCHVAGATITGAGPITDVGDVPRVPLRRQRPPPADQAAGSSRLIAYRSDAVDLHAGRPGRPGQSHFRRTLGHDHDADRAGSLDAAGRSDAAEHRHYPRSPG